MDVVTTDAGKAIGPIEHSHLDAQSRHCLRHLKAQRPGADHGQPRRQILQVKQAFVGQKTFAKACKFVRNGWCRPCGNHNGACLDDPAIVQLELPWRQKLCLGRKADVIGDLVDTFAGQPGKSVAFIAHTLHYCPAIDCHIRHRYAEKPGRPDSVSGMRRCDQKF